jgi:hypothetical protein
MFYLLNSISYSFWIECLFTSAHICQVNYVIFSRLEWVSVVIEILGSTDRDRFCIIQSLTQSHPKNTLPPAFPSIWFRGPNLCWTGRNILRVVLKGIKTNLWRGTTKLKQLWTFLSNKSLFFDASCPKDKRFLAKYWDQIVSLF